MLLNGADTNLFLIISDGVSNYRTTVFQDSETGTDRRNNCHMEYTFTATASIIKVEYDNLNTGSQIRFDDVAIASTTWATLEEFPNHVETSDFT